MNLRLYHGDCMEVMDTLKDEGVQVDVIITDPPYGVTNCAWDVSLLGYLIQTYTEENDTVLDFCMGSGSTGVACKMHNRNFIGIELERKYYEIAQNRIGEILI